MATSSLLSAPSKEDRLYEVFISFRGDDVRNNFVRHLHAALLDRGIRTYFDETNLQHGQTLEDELPKAIEESTIAMVVLSANYGSSTFCLRELVKIMECKIKSGLDVFPIFYNVDPSDVRKQKNNFFDAFSDHEKNFKDDVETVTSWRNALKEVAGLVGEDTRGKDELSCIKNMADKILKKLPVKASRFREFVVGIGSRISNIKKVMFSKPNEVVFIGILGMGGIGKTTTARATFEDCKTEFGGSCFLPNVRQSNNKLEKLQEKLLSNLLKTNFEGICDVIQGSSIIQERLKFKKVLLVIDDVDDIEQLNALAKECDWFGKGSVIIITTRDEHLVNDDYIKKYHVPTLPKNEALRLFCLHAFKNDYPPKDYKDLALQVLRYASGLPLALKVLGDHLYREDISFWKSTLIRLEDIPEDKIISKLQISFDGLSVLQQNIFLDIACFYRESPKHMVEKRLQTLNLHPKEGIDVLVRRSLIYATDNYIEMHGLLQEMGLYIVRQRANQDVRRYSRLWLEKDIVEVLSDITVSSEVEGICMGLNLSRDHGHDILSQLDQEAVFRKMNNLNFFELCGKRFKENYNAIVPESYGPVYNNKLRWFSFCHYRGQSLPKSFRPMNLVHLCLKYSEIEETPDFSRMPNLEELDLRESRRLVHVHPSLGDHMKIKCVHLVGCEKLEKFPKIKKMESLEILNLAYTNLKKIPEIYGTLNSLRKLNLRGTSIYGLPTSIVGTAPGLRKLKLACHRSSVVGNATFLQNLKLACRRQCSGGCIYSLQCHWSSSLEVVAGCFPGLVSLQITGSGIVRTLDFSLLPHLEKLDLSGSDKLEKIDASLGVHKRIKSINFRNCSKLVEFTRIIGDMNSLEELDLSSTSLKSFPEITGNVNRLVKLYLDSTKITTLPWSIGHATGLEVISMIGCKYLLTIPTSLLGLQLRRVSISGGPLKYFTDDTAQAVEHHSSIVSEGMETIRLSALCIDFADCGSLEELPESLLAREGALSLTMKECPRLTSWICLNLLDLLDKYQLFCNLQIHQLDRHDFLQAFSEWESVSNMLRKREEPFRVYVPGSEIPSWFEYRSSSRSVTAFLPPSDKWYNVKGLVVSSVKAGISTSEFFESFDPCSCDPQLHVLIMYIPISNIRGWEGQKKLNLFELPSLRHLGLRLGGTSRWGMRLVYGKDEDHPCEVVIEEDDHGDWDEAQLRMKIRPTKIGSIIQEYWKNKNQQIKYSSTT